MAWQRTQEGKKIINKSKEAAFLTRKLEESKENEQKSRDHSSHNAWKKKLKRAIKTEGGLAHVMSVLAVEDKRTKSVLSTLARATISSTVSTAPASATVKVTKASCSEPLSSPATTVK